MLLCFAFIMFSPEKHFCKLDFEGRYIFKILIKGWNMIVIELEIVNATKLT